MLGWRIGRSDLSGASTLPPVSCETRPSLRKHLRQVDSSKVEFFPASNRSRNTAGSGFPVRYGAVFHCNFEAIGA